MSKKIEIQYLAKMCNALNQIFDKDNENFIDMSDNDFDANLFFHVLGTRLPHFVYVRLTNDEVDPLEFNYKMNRLAFQNALDDQKRELQEDV